MESLTQVSDLPHIYLLMFLLFGCGVLGGFLAGIVASMEAP